MHEYPPQPKQEFWQPYLMQPQQPQLPQQPPRRSIGKFFAIGCGALVLLIIIVAAIVRADGRSPSSGNTPATVESAAHGRHRSGYTTRPPTVSLCCTIRRSLGDDHRYELHTEGGGSAVRLPDGRTYTTSRGQGA